MNGDYIAVLAQRAKAMEQLQVTHQKIDEAKRERGRAILVARDAGVTQVAIAHALGVSETTARRWESEALS